MSAASIMLNARTTWLAGRYACKSPGTVVELADMTVTLREIVDRSDDYLARQRLGRHLADDSDGDGGYRELARRGRFRGCSRPRARSELRDQARERFWSLGIAEHDVIAVGDRRLRQVAADVPAADDPDRGHGQSLLSSRLS
jgi:hypothetical protein